MRVSTVTWQQQSGQLCKRRIGLHGNRICDLPASPWTPPRKSSKRRGISRPAVGGEPRGLVLMRQCVARQQETRSEAALSRLKALAGAHGYRPSVAFSNRMRPMAVASTGHASRPSCSHSYVERKREEQDVDERAGKLACEPPPWSRGRRLRERIGSDCRRRWAASLLERPRHSPSGVAARCSTTRDIVPPVPGTLPPAAPMTVEARRALPARTARWRLVRVAPGRNNSSRRELFRAIHNFNAALVTGWQ